MYYIASYHGYLGSLSSLRQSKPGDLPYQGQKCQKFPMFTFCSLRALAVGGGELAWVATRVNCGSIHVFNIYFLGDIIRQFGISFHNADDKQVYTRFNPKDHYSTVAALDQISQCIKVIKIWMNDNM